MSEWKETKEAVPFDEAVPKANKNLAEVVRCKDCKHGVNATYDIKENKIISIDCRFAETHDPDWFCADGVKKDD